jgi:transcriptional regulator with XRE-family HTH domain/Zn-dependent peptidase ImmA (M78 family)
MTKKTFGAFARDARLNAELGLREAARRMAVSATYLSRVENDVDPASAELTVKMAKAYDREVEEFNAVAARPSVAAEVRGRAIQLSEELRALYRMGGTLSSDEVEEMIRFVLNKRGLSEEEIERELAQLRAELPRIRNNQGDGMFASDIRPRLLTKKSISAIAYRVLAEQGLDEQSYEPPTPVEMIVERQDGITYRISDLPASRSGEPIVLGLSKWNGLGERQIVINSALADSRKSTDTHRFSFTLGHELFHAIEHLPRSAFPKSAGLMRHQFDEVLVERSFPAHSRKSTAQKAVDRWTRVSKPRTLFTNEEWREWQANTFSASLLMPEWSVAAKFAERAGCGVLDVPCQANARKAAFDFAGGNLFRGTFYDKTLADIFAVSTQAMAIRLLDLGLVREEVAD